MSNLRVDWCGHDAATYAVEHWHYSEVMPAGQTAKLGVWEGGEFIGTVVFTNGASPWLATPYDWLTTDDLSELARVALGTHDAPVSKILSYATDLLVERNPGLRLLVSFADQKQDHKGTIYQASNWIYTGESRSNTDIQIGRARHHERSVGNKYGTSAVGELKKILDVRPIKRVSRPNKYKYVYPLDDETRRKIETLSEPYP